MIPVVEILDSGFQVLAAQITGHWPLFVVGCLLGWWIFYRGLLG